MENNIENLENVEFVEKENEEKRGISSWFKKHKESHLDKLIREAIEDDDYGEAIDLKTVKMEEDQKKYKEFNKGFWIGMGVGAGSLMVGFLIGDKINKNMLNGMIEGLNSEN